MVKIVDKQNIFNSGIISPKLHSRDDLKQYNNGIADGLNFVCSRYGPIEKRVGTNFIWDLGNPQEPVFFLPFVFSIKQSLLLEFLEKRIRFYTFDGVDFGPIEDPNKPGQQYEIATPFTAEQVKDMSYVQSLDVIYLAFAGGKLPPYVLTRYANNNWKLELFATEDGPYLDQNYTASNKMKIDNKSQETSKVTLTNFKLGKPDVGRWVRINTPRYNENTFTYEDRWSYGKIKAVAEDGMSFDIDWSYRSFVDETKNDWMTDPTSEWRLGAWHTGSGNNDYKVTYPTKVSIHQQRLVWAGMTDRPWIWTSNSFAYKNYAPSDYEGVISDSNSISYDISTDKVSEIFWVKSVKYLLIGTELGELRMYSAGTALTPADVVTNRESSYGSYDGEPIVTDDMIIFIQRLQRTLRSLTYDYNYDAYVGPELTVLAENLTTGGIKKIVYQKEPNNTIWALKEDGELLALTYDKVQDVIGWSRCKIAGENTKVIDLAVLPSATYQQDMLLLALERTINGKTVRYLELLSKNFINDVKQEEAYFLDCSARIKLDEPFDIVSGLDFLEGQKVRVTEKGGYQGDYVVCNGEIELTDLVTDIVVGLPYEAYFETLERDFGDRQLSTKMSKLRVYNMKMYVERTLGMTVKRLGTGLEVPLITFDPTKVTDTPPTLLTGKVEVQTSSAWDCDYRLRISSEPGLPCSVSGIILGVELNAI